ncbi:hypothetical protein [Oscillospiraceae bacterium]|nr:hypothetical protein [Oscillospiraceae bacterium]
MKIVNHLKTIRENKMKIPPKRTFGRGSLSKKIPDEWLRKGRSCERNPSGVSFAFNQPLFQTFKV